MEIPIIRIGNSKGIRLSKTILEQYHFTDRIDLVLEEDCIVIKPITQPRTGWDEAFGAMHEHGDDQLLIPDVFPDEENEEWK